MTIKIECPHCEQRIAAPGEVIGTIVTCPTCTQEFHVGHPTPPPLPSTDAAALQGVKRSNAKTIIIGGLGLLVATLLILAAISQSRTAAPYQSAPAASTQPPPLLPAEAEPIEIVPARNIDEQLFLVRLLEEMYSAWPSDLSRPQEIQSTLGTLRHRANRHYQDIRSKNLDPSLAALYQDFISAVDVYTAMLVDLGTIQSDAVSRAEKESTESGFNAGFAGGTTASEMYGKGADGSDAIITGAAVGLLSYFWDDYNKGKTRDAARVQATESAFRRFQNTLSTYIARSQSTTLSLAEKYSWGRGEAGFDEGPEKSELVNGYLSNRNLRALLPMLDSMQKRRPRDPFALSQRAYIASLDDQLTPSSMVECAAQCTMAASLVPAARAYDEYRGWILYNAGDIAVRAASKEIGNNSWARACNRTAAYAVRIWDECLKYNPQDATGEIGERRAWALMQSGHLKEALDQAVKVQPLRKDSVRYAYNFSCLLSSLQDTDNSFQWFSYAVRSLGFNNIPQAKADPDLELMRAQLKKQFDGLVEIRWRWEVKFGFFNDDLLIRNESAFPITNVVANGKFTASGRSWTPELKAARIEPGQTFKWENVFSLPGDKYDSTSTVLLYCDQAR